MNSASALSAALIGAPASSQPTARVRAIVSSMMGTLVEWYDFAIYGAASALVFGKIFFPNQDPITALLASYGSYAVGFLVRPIGGIFFSYFGDKYGRKPVLIATLTTMGVATTAIGLLPSYDSIGIWAPIALVSLRVVQGFGAGGEFAGAILFASEYAPPGRRGLYGSFAPCSVLLALLLSTSLFAAFSHLPTEEFHSWGWRIPFLLSVVVVGIGYFIRRRVEETPDFVAMRVEARKVRMPMVQVIREQPRLVLCAMGINIVGISAYLYVVFAISYITTTLGIPRSTTLMLQMLGFVAGACACLLGGALSDVIGRRAVLMTTSVLGVLYAFPFFWLLNTRNHLLIGVALMLGPFIGNLLFGAQSAFLTDLFDMRYRYSGITLAREITYAAFAGPLPFVATAAVAAAHGQSWPVSLIMMAMALTSVISVLALPRGAGEAVKPLKVTP